MMAGAKVNVENRMTFRISSNAGRRAALSAVGAAVLLLIPLAAALSLLAGCGAGNSASSDTSRSQSKLTIGIKWPTTAARSAALRKTQATGRDIPVLTTAILAEIQQVDPTTNKIVTRIAQIANRPTDGGNSQLTLANVPYVSGLTLKVTAWNQQPPAATDGTVSYTESPLASATPMLFPAGGGFTTNSAKGAAAEQIIKISLVTAIAKLGITGVVADQNNPGGLLLASDPTVTTAEIPVGVGETFSVTALDSTGAIVPVASSEINVPTPASTSNSVSISAVAQDQFTVTGAEHTSTSTMQGINPTITVNLVDPSNGNAPVLDASTSKAITVAFIPQVTAQIGVQAEPGSQVNTSNLAGETGSSSNPYAPQQGQITTFGLTIAGDILSSSFDDLLPEP